MTTHTTEMPGAWLTTCNCCHRDIHQHAMARVHNRDDVPLCEFCREVLAGEFELFGPPSVNHEMQWCGCGEPERVNVLMLGYLRSRAHEDWPKPAPEGMGDDTALLLSYMAASLDWTGHGGSVGGAWLTSAGLTALANLEQVVARAEAREEQT